MRLKSGFGEESGLGSGWNCGNATSLNLKMREKVTLLEENQNVFSLFSFSMQPQIQRSI